MAEDQEQPGKSKLAEVTTKELNAELTRDIGEPKSVLASDSDAGVVNRANELDPGRTYDPRKLADVEEARRVVAAHKNPDKNPTG